MRIVIEIDGHEVASVGAGTPAYVSSEAPPPEVLKAAERLGAISAGAAPRAAPPNVSVDAPAIVGALAAVHMDAGPSPNAAIRGPAKGSNPRRARKKRGP